MKWLMLFMLFFLPSSVAAQSAAESGAPADTASAMEHPAAAAATAPVRCGADSAAVQPAHTSQVAPIPEVVGAVMQSEPIQRLINQWVADRETPWSVKLGYSGLGVAAGVALTIILYGVAGGS